MGNESDKRGLEVSSVSLFSIIFIAKCSRI